MSGHTNEQIDAMLDKVLHASGSALRHYGMPKSLDDMRAAMRDAMALSGATPLLEAAQELIDQAEQSLDYRPEFRRAISKLQDAIKN